MAIGRDERRTGRRQQVLAVMADHDVEAALDLLELTQLAWHDCHGDVTPPDEVIDDILVLTDGSLSGLIAAAGPATVDWRDARVAADVRRR